MNSIPTEDPRSAQLRRDAAARRDYSALADSLPEDVRALLTDSNDRVRPDDSLVGNRKEHDISELQIGVSAPDMAAELDTLEDQLAERFKLTAVQAAGIARWHQSVVKQESERGLAIRLARAVGVLLGSSNLKLAVYALAYATGTAAANGLGSMRRACSEILKPDGKPVSFAALSKQACWLVGFLQLPTPPGMKSPEAVAAYSSAQKADPWRKRPGRFLKMINRIQ